jgi:outer membrane receptor protein involved in Fe transport
VINYLQGRWRLNEVRWAGDLQRARGEFNRPWRATELGFSLHPRGAALNLSGPDQFQTRDGDSLTAELTFDLTSWLTGRVGYNWFDSYFDEFDTPSRVTGDGLLNLSLARGRPFANEDTTIQADFVASFDTGDIQHNLLFGGEMIDTEQVRYSYTVDYNQADPVPDGMGGTLTGRNIYRFHNPFLQPPLNLNAIFTTLNETGRDSAETTGYYLTHQASWFDERMHTMLGVRQVGFESDLDELDETVYSAGINYRVTDGMVLFASDSENFIPTINLSAEGPGARPEEIFQLPTESAGGWDIGIKTDWHENKLSGTLTFFELERQNITRNDVERRETDPRNNDDDPNNDVFFRSASGLERSQGVEIDIIWTPVNNYQVVLAYSYMWEANLISDPNYVPGTLNHAIQIGRRLRTAPDHLFSVFNRYKFTEGPLKGFSVGAGARYTGEHGPLNHNAQFNVINDSSLVFDAFIKYQTKIFEQDTEFQLNVENVTDEFYIIGNRSAGDPRKFYFSVNLTF